MEEADETTIKIGQVWKEVDPRFQRFVRVLQVEDGRRGIAVQTVLPNGDGSLAKPRRWDTAPRSRTSWCDRERFNGKRGGYALHEDVP